MVAIQLDDFARCAGTRADERAAAGQHVDLAGELSRSMDGDERLGGAVWLDNVDLTCSDDEERHDLIPRLDKHLARLDVAHLPVRRDARDLCRCQRRKHLVDTRGQGQGDW